MSCLGYLLIKLTRAYFPRNTLDKFAQLPWPQDRPTRNAWVNALTRLETVRWKPVWMSTVPTLYGCGDKLWVPLVGPRGIIGYAPSLVMRQAGAVQCIPATRGLGQLDCTYGKDPSAPDKMRSADVAWKQAKFMEQLGGETRDTTEGYIAWQKTRKRGFTPCEMDMPTAPRQRVEEPQASQSEMESPERQAWRILQVEHEKMKEEFKRKEAEWEEKEKQLSHTISQSADEAQALERRVQEMKELNKAEAIRYRKESRSLESKVESNNKRCRKYEKDLKDMQEVYSLDMDDQKKKSQELKTELAKLRKENQEKEIEVQKLRKENQNLKTARAMDSHRIQDLESMRSQLTNYIRDREAQHERDIQELMEKLQQLPYVCQRMEMFEAEYRRLEDVREVLTQAHQHAMAEMMNMLDSTYHKADIILEMKWYERKCWRFYLERHAIADHALEWVKRLDEVAIPDNDLGKMLWVLREDLLKLKTSLEDSVIQGQA